MKKIEIDNTFDKYPSLQEAERIIHDLEKHSWEKYFSTNHSADELEKHIKSIRDRIFSYLNIGIPALVFPVDEDHPFKFDFYRVRPLDSFHNVNLTCEYSYSPIKFCKNTQRVNYPFHPVFYASLHPLTALVETIKNNHADNPNREYCISKWNIRSYKGLKVAPFLYHNLSQENPFVDIIESIFNKIPEIFKGLPPDKTEAMKHLLKFYSKIFLEDDKYAISTYIGHLYIYANHNFRTDIFIYPSVQLKNDAINFAIHPNVVDERMFLERVYIVKVNSINLKTSETGLTISKYSEVKNGFFYWKDIHPNDKRYQEVLKEDFGNSINSQFIPNVIPNGE